MNCGIEPSVHRTPGRVKNMKKAILGWVFLIIVSTIGANQSHSDELCADGRVLADCDVDRELLEKCAADYTVYSVPFNAKLRAGAGFGSISLNNAQKKSSATGDLSLIFLVDLTRLSLEGGAETGGGFDLDSGYAGGKLSLSMRKNLKKNECSKWWVGADPIDVSGRYSSLPGVDSYFSGKIPAYLGYFSQVGNSCRLQLYARVGAAWFDDRAPEGSHFIKPMSGAKGTFRCKNGIDVYATSASISYDHLFNIGAEDTHLTELDLAHTFTLDTRIFGPLQLGVFANGQYSVEGDAFDSESKRVARIMGGIQVMGTGKKKKRR